MKLPNRDRAYIPPKKLYGYLLSETHAVGKSEAKFFRSLGFDETNIPALEKELLMIAQTEDVVEANSSPYGMKYIIDGLLNTPHGTTARIRTVWIIETGEDTPRFVTAHPN
jgi:hypothetical protein